MRASRLGAVAAAALLAVTVVTGCTPEPIVAVPSATRSNDAKPLVIAAADLPDTGNAGEQDIVAYVYAAALEAAGIKTVVSTDDPTGASLVTRLASGAVDIVPEFTGSLLRSVGPASVARTPADQLTALAASLPAGVAMTQPAKAEDNETLVVTQVTAQKYNLKTIDDLAKVCDKVVLGAPETFRARGSGLAALEKTYGCRPATVRSLPNTQDALLMALLRDEVQVADLQGASPAVPDNDLVVLTDPKNVLAVEQLVPVVHTRAVPDAVRQVLDKVSAQLSTTDLMQLRGLSRGEHHATPRQIAAFWLASKGLVKAAQ
ncbi:ABC transporter substrate-binding protein [Specibacter cremeus]|uniref:ABC transporter substrate-binding protein n=1 Tax=Specibacter cremeus TaxID=1629051 RepID=UPI000F7B8CF5|nr:ABC transporter substrate-binding protein [Specibacter cremeus]